ncbi:uncharacterized protein LOC143849523 isoform X2 [Tasmannia lanceolata]|uniref:uncharacterized protein LOC143849523 isoform X2 n=1 Tax=Tasmannia lanceolata TaxID=3420 RepID=UPI0040641270
MGVSCSTFMYRCQSTECWGGAMEGNFPITNGSSPLSTTWIQSIHVIPVSFSIQLKRDRSELWLNMNRRLLNTEKLIFKADSHDLHSDHSEMYVLVTVEPAGIVAKPVREREFVIFNIVCDELSFGIPHKAWWVGIMVILCLGMALIIPYFLPSYLLLKNQSSRSSNQDFLKSPSRRRK